MTRVVITLWKLWEQWEFIAYYLCVDFEVTEAGQSCNCRVAGQAAQMGVGISQLEQTAWAGVRGRTIANQQCSVYSYNLWTLLHICLAYMPGYAHSQRRWSCSLDIIFLWPDGTCSCSLLVSWMTKIVVQLCCCSQQHCCADSSPCVVFSMWGMRCLSLHKLLWLCHLGRKKFYQKKNIF